MVCCEKGVIDEIDCILKLQSDLINQRSIQGWSPIIVASYNTQFSTIKLLLKNGANINDTGNNGTSVFMYAKSAFINDQSDDFTFLQFLLDKGALINHRDNYGRTVLEYINDVKSKNLHNFLLTNGACK